MSPTTAPTTQKLIAGQAESRQAREALAQSAEGPLDRWTATQSGSNTVTLPPELSSLITKVVETVARGGTVTVGSMPEDVTTTVAADLLGISRPTLMKLTADGAIPSHKVGSHTRLKSADVLAFRRARLERQRQAAEELLGLEDEG